MNTIRELPYCAQFHKAVKQKILFSNFLADQEMAGVPVAAMVTVSALAGNLPLLSNVFALRKFSRLQTL